MRFSINWELLEEAEAKLNACGFEFKSVVKRENLLAVMEVGVPVGIARMLVDEANSYKRFRISSSTLEPSHITQSDNEKDEASDRL